MLLVFTGKCAPGWKQDSGRCYRFMGGALPYYQARDFCRVSLQQRAGKESGYSSCPLHAANLPHVIGFVSPYLGPDPQHTHTHNTHAIHTPHTHTHTHTHTHIHTIHMHACTHACTHMERKVTQSLKISLVKQEMYVFCSCLTWLSKKQPHISVPLVACEEL